MTVMPFHMTRWLITDFDYSDVTKVSKTELTVIPIEIGQSQSLESIMERHKSRSRAVARQQNWQFPAKRTNEIWSISTKIGQVNHTEPFENGINSNSIRAQSVPNDKRNFVSFNKSQSRVDPKSHSITKLTIIPTEIGQSWAQSGQIPQKDVT